MEEEVKKRTVVVELTDSQFRDFKVMCLMRGMNIRDMVGALLVRETEEYKNRKVD